MRSRNEAQLHRPRRTRRHHRRTRLVRSSLDDCRRLPRKIRTLVVELQRREGSLRLAACGLPRRHGRVQRSRYSRKLRKGRMKTSRYKEGDEPDRIDLRHLMPTFPDNPASRFFGLLPTIPHRQRAAKSRDDLALCRRLSDRTWENGRPY